MKCDYCDERDGIQTIYHEIYGSRNRIVHKTEHFSVFPCLGQLREGHLLIASNKHVNAVGMLNRNEIDELERLIFRISGYFRKEYGTDTLCFEHGVLSEEGSNGGCGIYHMHIHLLPADQDEFFKVRNSVRRDSGNKIIGTEKLSDTGFCIAESRTYILLMRIYGKQEKESYIVTNVHNYFESQYMRKVVGKVFGRKDWDWREKKQKEPEFLKTLEKSRSFFNSFCSN